MSGLAIATANGLLLKGGREAKHSNQCLHGIVQEALACEIPDHTGAVGLVDGREEVEELLSFSNKIDLVIPRGGNELVRSIMEQSQGRVPVLGHTEGICHVYVHKDADLEKAARIGEHVCVHVCETISDNCYSECVWCVLCFEGKNSCVCNYVVVELA